MEAKNTFNMIERQNGILIERVKLANTCVCVCGREGGVYVYIFLSILAAPFCKVTL